MKNESVLSKEELVLIGTLLAKLEPGYLPSEIFNQVTRLTVTPIIEVVPLRKNNGVTELLLLERPQTDPVWPGMLHTPGTVIRTTDTLQTAIDRLLKGELAGTTCKSPVFVQNILHHSGRGMESTQVYWVEIMGDPAEGVMYDASNLPNNLVASQRDFIPAAVAAFNSHYI